MSTEPVFIYEHIPTKTILRSINSGGELQILRDFKEIARISMHLNYPPSCSDDGIVYFHNSYSRHMIDLNKPFPQEPKKAPDGNLIHPDGKHIVKYAMDEFPYKYKEESHAGLLLIDIKTGKPETLWKGDTSNPDLVPIFGQTEEEASEKEDYDDTFEKVKKPIEFPFLVLAEDKKTWALIQSHRMVIGKEGNKTASVFWNKYTFYPIKAFFDLEKNRLLLAGREGIAAFTLDGKPAAYWKALLPCEPYKEYGRTISEVKAPVVSPPILRNGEILAVVCTKKGKSYPDPSWYEILRFDRENLSLLGKLSEFPKKRDPDENASLLSLSDGSLVWAPNTLPLIVLPAPNSKYKSTDIAKILGDEIEPVIPHPADSWYIKKIGETGDISELSKTDSNERKSFARYLLNELMEDRRFSQLIETDISAFSPYIDQVAQWNEDRLKLLEEMDWQNYWKIMEGLPDASVLKIADKLKSKKKLKDSDRIYLKLLIGSGTPLSLEILAGLARTHSVAAELCGDYLLHIPESGPAVPRLCRKSLDIVAYEDERGENAEGIFYPLAHNEYLPEKFGWTCKSPMGHILSVDLSLLNTDALNKSPLRCHHWFLSSGEECCDEAINTYYAYRNLDDSDRRVKLIADLSVSNSKERPQESSCEGSEEYEEPEKEYRIVLEPHNPDRDWKTKSMGKLGGYPDWWQSPEVPSCPECGKMMFYVGYVKADAIRSDMIDAALYGFHCEDCGIGAQIVQIT